MNLLTNFLSALGYDNSKSNVIYLIGKFPHYYIGCVFTKGHLKRIRLIEKDNTLSNINSIFKVRPSSNDTRMSGLFCTFGNNKSGFLNYKRLINEDQDLRSFDNSKQYKDRSFLGQVIREQIGKKSIGLTGKIKFEGIYTIYLPLNEHKISFSSELNSENEKYFNKVLSFIKKSKELNVKGEITLKVDQILSLKPNEKKILKDIKILSEEYKSICEKAKHITDDKEPIYQSNNLQTFLCKYYTDDSLVIQSNISKEELGSINKFGITIKNSKEKDTQCYIEIYNLIKKIINKEITTPEGITLNTERTEAMYVIDINGSKYKSKNKNISISNHIKAVNEIAIKEIIHQICLRNINGLVIIDLIDLYRPEDKKYIISVLENEIEKNKDYIFRFNYCKTINILTLSVGSNDSFSSIDRLFLKEYNKEIYKISNMMIELLCSINTANMLSIRLARENIEHFYKYIKTKKNFNSGLLLCLIEDEKHILPSPLDMGKTDNKIDNKKRSQFNFSATKIEV